MKHTHNPSIIAPSPNQTFASKHDYEEMHDTNTLTENSNEEDIEWGPNKGHEKCETKLLGVIHLNQFSKTSRFILCAGGVCTCYVLQSLTKEYLFLTYKSKINFSCFLALVQCFGYTALAGIELYLRKKESSSKLQQKSNAPRYNLPFIICMFVIGFLGDVSMAFSNVSLLFLPFPTVVMIKSCKILAAMFLSIMLHHLSKSYNKSTCNQAHELLYFRNPKYNKLDYTSAFVLVVGLFVLAIANSKESSLFLILSSDWRGVTLALLSVFADALVSLIQELVMREKETDNQYPVSPKKNKQNKEEPASVIFYSYGFGFLILFLYCTVLNDELWVVLNYAIGDYQFVLLLLSFVVLGHFGVSCTLSLLKQFGAFISLTTASCRKAITILVSFLIFSKPITPMYQLAIVLVFTGIIINVYNKNAKITEEQKPKTYCKNTISSKEFEKIANKM
ncbi:adenosine 3'-phospho 5'-phosphosulfate transporter [Acrasis kona]|uniref:Adenosine 3'-phospho 5'-phosphosulfate transporter n=1 Tax=Acrasis kona TaxID=1008807 RepID=A0AAW2ZBH1_9EUKA